MSNSTLSNRLITFYSEISSNLKTNPFERTLLEQHPNYYKETELETKHEIIQDMMASGRDAINIMVRHALLNAAKNDINKVQNELGALIDEYSVFADRHISLYHTTRLQSWHDKTVEATMKHQNFITNLVEKQQKEADDQALIAHVTKRENEELKAKVAELQKQNTKIQNTLAKTTIALEKSQELLQKNAQINIKKIGKGK